MARWGGFVVGGHSWPWQYWVGYKGLVLVGPSLPLGLKHFVSLWIEGVGTEGASNDPNFSKYILLINFFFLLPPFTFKNIYIQTPFDVLMSHFF